MRTFILVCLLVLAPVSAHAQPAHDDEAHALFAAAQLAYSDGRYEEALDYFERSHRLSGRPELLYNIALAAEHLRHDARALEAYEAFVAAVPGTEYRAAIEARVQILRRAVAAREEEPPTEIDAPVETREPPVEPVASPAPAPAPASGGGIAIGGLVLAIGGGAALVAGGVLAGIAAADESTVERATYPAQWEDVRGAYDRAFPFSVAGWTLVGVGAALLVAGTVWLVIGEGSSAPTEVAIGPDGLRLRGSF